MNRKMV